MDTPIKMTGWSPAMSLVSKIKPSTTFDLTFTNLNHIVGKGEHLQLKFTVWTSVLFSRS